MLLIAVYEGTRFAGGFGVTGSTKAVLQDVLSACESVAIEAAREPKEMEQQNQHLLRVLATCTRLDQAIKDERIDAADALELAQLLEFVRKELLPPGPCSFELGDSKCTMPPETFPNRDKVEELKAAYGGGMKKSDTESRTAAAGWAAHQWKYDSGQSGKGKCVLCGVDVRATAAGSECPAVLKQRQTHHHGEGTKKNKNRVDSKVESVEMLLAQLDVLEHRLTPLCVVLGELLAAHPKLAASLAERGISTPFGVGGRVDDVRGPRPDDPGGRPRPAGHGGGV